MVVSDVFMGADNLPSWIELVDVSFFDEDRPPEEDAELLGEDLAWGPVALSFQKKETPVLLANLV